MARSQQPRGVRSYPGGLELPEGVQLAEWYLEKVRWQNPRIRALLGCLNLMDDVLESNFAILHSSPIRIREIWAAVREVGQTLREELAPLLERGSALPQLDQAITDSRDRLVFLTQELLIELDRFPEEPDGDQLDELRGVLCVATGKLHAFLLDSIGGILAADPRSQEDSDYFLSRKFARDVEEAEWLFAYVVRLEEYLERIEEQQRTLLEEVSARLDEGGPLPPMDEWETISAFMSELSGGLTTTLRRVLGLRGIRIDELQVLEAHSRELPERCRVLEELYQTTRIAVGQLHGRLETGTTAEPIEVIKDVMRARISDGIRDLVLNLKDLGAFVPLWLQGLGNRRALMLQRRGGSEDESEEDTGITGVET